MSKTAQTFFSWILGPYIDPTPLPCLLPVYNEQCDGTPVNVTCIRRQAKRCTWRMLRRFRNIVSIIFVRWRKCHNIRGLRIFLVHVCMLRLRAFRRIVHCRREASMAAVWDHPIASKRTENYIFRSVSFKKYVLIWMKFVCTTSGKINFIAQNSFGGKALLSTPIFIVCKVICKAKSFVKQSDL